ncbi:hypothetical protein ABLE94_23020 [Gordonia sp. VNK1]|uniref:hypothetical protein n=1 Tax=Gordonia oleivorans TaxID=3156618 RepID=UPI0032B3563E
MSLVALQEIHARVDWGNGRSENIAPSGGFDDDTLTAMRDAMYQPGLGTWFSAVLRVDPSGGIDGEFNYDDEPQWAAPVDPIAYVTDAKKYPRDVKLQPEWLQAKLADGHGRRHD